MTKFMKLTLDAFGSLVSLAPDGRPYRTLPPTTDAWRSDWLRIGGDMSRVIEREHGKTKKAYPEGRRKAS